MTGDSVIWRSEVGSIISAVAALAFATGSYTPEARACVEACATALGVVVAPLESWNVWEPGRESVRLCEGEKLLAAAETQLSAGELESF